MTIVKILYHSGFGHTQMQAQYVEQGAASVAGVKASMVTAEDATKNLDILSDADAIIFGSPTYMGSVSAPFKAFMDASSKVWYSRGWKDKVAGGFTNSHSLSGDKLNTLIQMNVFAMQHGMIWVGQAEMNGSPENGAGKDDAINRMGASMGAMAQSENSPPAMTPPSGDLRTAELYGKRIAEITKKLKG